MHKPPKNDSTYSWTSHVYGKMLHYGIGEGRIRRIIRAPARIEEGVAENTIAAMQPTGVKGQHEMWVMYKLEKGKIKVITAWRYPGKSPARDPIPKEVIAEIRQLI
jgi:hypothetical protein